MADSAKETVVARASLLAKAVTSGEAAQTWYGREVRKEQAAVATTQVYVSSSDDEATSPEDRTEEGSGEGTEQSSEEASERNPSRVLKGQTARSSSSSSSEAKEG